MQETISTPGTPGRRARRSYTKEFKTRLVAQCTNGDKSIAQVAMEHQINANLIHKWSRQLKRPDGQTMVPVEMVESPIAATGDSRIDVLVGGATVRFIGGVDHQNARVVLELLR